MAKNINIDKPNKKPTFFICTKCAKRMKSDCFYGNSSKPLGILPVCKECMYSMAMDGYGVTRQGMIDVCKYLDMPFIQNIYEESLEKHPEKPKMVISYYFSIKMKKKEYRDLHFVDSIFDAFKDLEEVGILEEEVTIDLIEHFTPLEVEPPEEQVAKKQSRTKRLQELKAKWGNFDSIEYLERCEKLYLEIVQGGYIILSAMHDLSVRNYCKLQIDWDIAQETRDYNAMAQLKQPLKDARTDAKLNPSQFKAADFQNSGANSFGEITRMIAKRDGFIPLPMKYFKQPTDQIDWLIVELINYDRHILNLPEVTYEEVYAYYIDRVNKFNKEYGADIENGDLGSLDPETRGNKKHYTIIGD